MIIHANDQPQETLENYSGGKGHITFTTLLPDDALFKDEALCTLCSPVTASRWMTALPKTLQPAMCSTPPMAAPMASVTQATATLSYWPVCCWKIE